MNTLIAAYSLFGNNLLLAKHISDKTGADLLIIKEKSKKRGYIKCALDVLFRRMPKIQPDDKDLSTFKRILIICPVWATRPASPVISWLSKNKMPNIKYGFFSISGGAFGNNAGLYEYIENITKKDLFCKNQIFIKDILPEKDRENAKKISQYRLTSNDINTFYQNEIKSLIKIIKDY